MQVVCVSVSVSVGESCGAGWWWCLVVVGEVLLESVCVSVGMCWWGRRVLKKEEKEGEATPH